ncbi:MAG: hypothetical protein ACW99U_14380 [Candidatus Thorarchaeota archaeon]
MPKSTNTTANLRLAEDGFPVPVVNRLKTSYSCICPICTSADATMKVSKSGNWVVRCPRCVIILYLNDVTSINLFRGLQSYFATEPAAQVGHAAKLVEFAPDEGM